MHVQISKAGMHVQQGACACFSTGCPGRLPLQGCSASGHFHTWAGNAWILCSCRTAYTACDQPGSHAPLMEMGAACRRAEATRSVWLAPGRPTA